MNRAESAMAGHIDRSRNKAATSARTLQVRTNAREAVNALVMAADETDRAETMGAAIRHLRALYGAGEGEETAVALFGSLAWSATLQTGRAVARARADQVFAANENRGPVTAGTALASALRQMAEPGRSILRPVADELEAGE